MAKTTLPASLRALQHRDFRAFWVGQLVSLVGTWMQSVGQAWLVLELTNSPFKLGLVSTLQFGPFLVFSFFAGALVDRLVKRRVIMATQTLLLAQSATLTVLVWSGHVQYWHVAVLASVYGLANTLDMPARQAFIVELVGKADLMNAITLNSAAFNAARVLGPAAAGLLIARFGVAPAFALNALSFVAVIVALLIMRAEGLPQPRSRGSLLADILEGVSYATRTPRVLFVLSLLLGVGLFVFNYNIVVPLLARGVLHQDAGGFGVLMAMLGGGALLGAITLALLGLPRPPVWLLVAPGVVVSVAMLAVGFVNHFWVAAAMLLVMGYAGILFMTGCNTTVQLTVPDQLRGRMMSLYTFVFVGVTPAGSFLVGTIAEHLGPRAAFIASGGLGLVSVIVVMAWWKSRRRERPAG